jgi:hypothetical protein
VVVSSVKSESLRVMTMTLVDNLDGGPLFGGCSFGEVRVAEG